MIVTPWVEAVDKIYALGNLSIASLEFGAKGSAGGAYGKDAHLHELVRVLCCA